MGKKTIELKHVSKALGGKQLIEFAKLKNTCIDSELNGYGTELSTILDAIEEQTLLPPKVLREFFWDQFIADAFLGNFDRHNGNWGVLVDENLGTAELAPVYDCGSCLFPQVTEDRMEKVLNRPYEIDDRVRLFPKSTLMINRARINYYEYITSIDNADCDAALAYMSSRINMEKIGRIIAETPGLSEVQRQFYYTMIYARKTGIIDKAMDLLEHKG